MLVLTQIRIAENLKHLSVISTLEHECVLKHDGGSRRRRTGPGLFSRLRSLKSSYGGVGSARCLRRIIEGSRLETCGVLLNRPV